MSKYIFQFPEFIKRQVAIQVIDLGRFLRAKAVYTTVPLALFFGIYEISVAQTTETSVTNNVAPGFLSNSDPYSIDTTVSCPTPSFSITAFGGFADGSANETIININSNANLNNYGVAFGINVPLGGSLGRFCKDYAAKRLLISEQTIQLNQATVESNLLNACIAFKGLKVDFESSAFREGGPFAKYAICEDVGFKTPSDEPSSSSSLPTSVPAPPLIPLDPTETQLRIIR